jgi:SAM-dependent methyltransferase
LRHDIPGESIHSLCDHYSHHDPHEEVSQSKTAFYNMVLDDLSSVFIRKPKKILDIGCGYGYFLDLASQKGWQPTGIEIGEEAVKSAQVNLGIDNILQGKLKDKCLSGSTFDAITLWDVLAIVDDPYDEIEECLRLLKKGGIIGIRTRNVWFQKMVYRLFVPIRRSAPKLGFKEPYVFNKYCFSAKSFYELLSRLGFTNIKILNSPLTSGNPYNHMRFNCPVRLMKSWLDFSAKFVFQLTRGRSLIAPFLLIWAQKP